MNKNFFITIGILILFVVLLSFSENASQKSYFKQHAQDIVAKCATAEYRPACYDAAIPKLMDEGMSMEDAFEVTRAVQDIDDMYFYCHVLGHYLAEKETAKDPLRWKDVVARAPSGICSNGAIHGAFQARFKAETLPDASVDELKKELTGVCEPREGWSPTGLEQATCTHALGHLTMYATAANIQKSLALCDEIAIHDAHRDMRQLCYDGAFMQLFQPLEPEDFALIKGKELENASEANAFCETFIGEYRGSCITESWPFSREEIGTPEGTVAFCSRFTDAYQEWRCYAGLFYILTAQSGLRPEWAEDFCPGIPEERRGQCFANAASRLVETDWRKSEDAARICSLSEKYNVGDACWNELLFYASYNFKEGSIEFKKLCSLLPDEWGEKCLAGEQTQISVVE